MGGVRPHGRKAAPVVLSTVMKHPILKSLQVLPFVAALSIGGIASAQSIEATTTTVTSDGTVSEFGPQGLIVRTSVDTQPIRYISTDTTNYVDEHGNPVTAALVRSGLPVTVFYTKVGDRLIASKVMVRTGTAAAVPGTTTTTTAMQYTTSEGTITEFGPGRIVLRSDGSPQPLPYTYTNTTTYVDEGGAPIAVDTVRSGVPVTVYYTKVGDSLVASKVVVKRAAVSAPRVVLPQTQIVTPPTVETRRTTTTIETKKPD